MEELENTEQGTARTNEQLRSDINQNISDVQEARSEGWGDALKRQQRERNAQNGVATYSQMKDLVGRHELAELQNSQRAQDAIASALAIAQQKGGRLPSEVTDYLNRQFGFDGKTLGIIEGGINPKTGEFGFVFGERDRNGNMSYREQTIPRTVQLGLMEGYPSLFGEDAVNAHKQEMLKTYSQAEIDSYSKVARLARERLASRIAELSPKEKTSGWSPERIELEKERLRLRDNEEKGRNTRAGTKNDAANARLAASVAKHMNEIKMGLGLDDNQSAQFQASLTKILADAFAPSETQTPDGGGEGGTVKMSRGGETQRKMTYNDLKPGQTFTATGKDGKTHTYRKTESGHERID